MFSLSRTYCLLALMLFVAADTEASVVMSNLGVADNGTPQGISNNQDVSTENGAYTATSFVVGAVAGNVWSLNSATLSMDDANPGTTGTFTVGVYTNNTIGVPDPRPGTLVGTLTGSTSPLTAGQYVYSAAADSILLNSGQTYWLVASALNTTGANQGYFWKVASDTSYTTQSSGWGVDPTHSIATFGTNYASDTGTWSDNTAGYDNVVYRTASASGTARNWGADEFLQFSLSASASVSAVPEPSKAGFVLLGLLTLGLRRRR